MLMTARFTRRMAVKGGKGLMLSTLAMSSAMGFSSAAGKFLFNSPLLTPDQVRASLKGEPPARIKFLDASWHLDRSRDAKKEFAEEHIKGAVRFDIDEIADKSLNLPHMIPSAEAFSDAASSLGLSNEDHIVVYTTQQCFSAARCWWTFKTFGHDQVYILDGGLPAWKAAGGETESGEIRPQSSRPNRGLVQSGGNAWLLDKKGFQAKLRPEVVYSWRQVLNLVEVDRGDTCGPQICDARSAQRFNAEVDEPRQGVARGRIPGSLNVPFGAVLVDGDWTKFKQPDDIRDVFVKAGVDLSDEREVVTSCGSGVTAAVLSFAMVLAGKDVARVPVYDGSWAEWGSRADLPKEP